MAMPSGIGIIDTMIGFPAEDFKQYDFIREQLKDGSKDFDFPVEYMFKHVPKALYGAPDPIAITLHEMDRFGVEVGVVGVGNEVSRTVPEPSPGLALPAAAGALVGLGWRRRRRAPRRG